MSDERHDPRPTDSEIGDALRSGDEELSPGFYTRARARFEQSRAPSGRRRFSFGSWKLAGVVATIALAAVLFVPYLTRQELDSQAVSAPKVVVDKLESAARELAPPASDVAANVATEPAAVEESVVRRRDAPEDKRKATREMASVGYAQDEGNRQVAPPPAAAAAPARAESLMKKDSGTREYDADAYGMAERESLDDSAETLIVPLATAQIVLLLPQATLPPAGVEVYEITDPQRWSVMMEGEAGIALAPLGPVRPFVRLVLVVAPTPVDCSISRVVSSGERIDFALVPGRLEQTTGCAAVLAADSRPIEARIVADE